MRRPCRVAALGSGWHGGLAGACVAGAAYRTSENHMYDNGVYQDLSKFGTGFSLKSTICLLGDLRSVRTARRQLRALRVLVMFHELPGQQKSDDSEQSDDEVDAPHARYARRHEAAVQSEECD